MSVRRIDASATARRLVATGLTFAVSVLAFGTACSPAPRAPVSAQETAELVSAAAGEPADDVDRTGSARLVALGDSLTAGLGLEPHEAYPARLQERLDTAGYDLVVVNAGVSGDTTAGGLRRLEWALDGPVDVLIVALGGNDGLRGLPVEQMKENLSTIIATAQARGTRVLLAGMEAPPNFGQVYTREFRDVFHQLAREHDVVFVPFLLDGVAGVPQLNQSDGIHPNAEGAARVAEHLWPHIESMVRQVTVEAGQ